MVRSESYGSVDSCLAGLCSNYTFVKYFLGFYISSFCGIYVWFF